MRFLVILPILAIMTLSVVAGEQAKGEPPAKRELFAKEEWYKDQKGKELEYIGVLSRQDQGGGVGIGRFNPYRLTMTVTKFIAVQKNIGNNQVVNELVPVTEQIVKEVYVGAQGDLLAPYVGKSVKLIGKPVKMEVVGRIHDEIWPARVELMTSVANPGDKKAEEKQLPVLASAFRPGAKADPNGPKKAEQFVVRDPMELVNHYPWNLLDAIPQVVAKQAEAQVAKALGVDAIDWKKQMLIVLIGIPRNTAASIRMEIAGLPVADGKLTVKWREVSAAGGGGKAVLTQPSKMLLVERIDGPVTFGKEGAATEPGVIRPGAIQIKPIQIKPIQIKPLPLIKPAPVDPKKAPEPGKVDGVVHADAVIAAPQGESAPKVIAQAKSRLVGGQGGHVVIRSEEELVKAAGGKGKAEDLLAKISKQLKVDGIDLKKQMLVVISGGTQRTGGYSVEVKGTKVDGKTLTIEWKLNTPPPGAIVTQALTNPAATALIERFEGEVRFNPPAAPGGLKGPQGIQ